MNVVRGCCWALSVGALALVGCVPGYNSMVFATKTNAGLVVDTKPPEVNLDIGRFEGLFAPTYEAGKTPPVMASFRFDSNKGFLSNYIGSAFTTGDAAVAMARLYDTPDDEALHKANKVNLEDDKAYAGAHWKKIEKNYDSAVDLAMVPKQPWFVPKEEPGAVRPVLFATDTSFGFKVAWQTAESPLPDYLRLAYQRREIAFAAVTVGPKLKVDPSGETAPQALNGLEARVPSLLATVDAQVRANEFINSDFNYLQYFASGSAATALAMRRGVRDAMLHRLDPKQAQWASKTGVAFRGESAMPGLASIATLRDLIQSIAEDTSAAMEDRIKARDHLAALDKLESSVPATWTHDGYSIPSSTVPSRYAVHRKASDAIPESGFNRAHAYLAHLNDTEKKLSEMLLLLPTKTLALDSKEFKTDFEIADQKVLFENRLKVVKTDKDKYFPMILGHKDVAAATKFACNTLSPPSGE